MAGTRYRSGAPDPEVRGTSGNHSSTDDGLRSRMISEFDDREGYSVRPYSTLGIFESREKG